MSDQPESQQWWIARDGQPTGPFSTAYVVAGLKSGTIQPEELACPVGGDAWKQIADQPAFRGIVSTTAPPTIPASNSDSPLTNPNLPTMANWICIYAIAVAPASWLVGHASCCISPSAFHAESPLFGWDLALNLLSSLLSLGVTIVLVVGGLRLRSLRRSGVTLIKAGIWIAFAMGVIVCFAHFALGMVAPEGDYSKLTTAEILIGFFQLLVGLGELVFMVIALVWLHRQGSRLALADS